MKATYQSATVPPYIQPASLLDDEVHDPYQVQGNLHETSVCVDCGAVYVDGEWQWTPAPANALPIKCPACRRLDDKLAAGLVLIEGRFAREYHAELRLLIETLEKRTKSQYPMQRIMSIEDQPDSLLVTTTDIRLARCIGEALHCIYKGNLDFHYHETEYVLQVRWQRWT